MKKRVTRKKRSLNLGKKIQKCAKDVQKQLKKNKKAVIALLAIVAAAAVMFSPRVKQSLSNLYPQECTDCRMEGDMLMCQCPGKRGKMVKSKANVSGCSKVAKDSRGRLMCVECNGEFKLSRGKCVPMKK